MKYKGFTITKKPYFLKPYRKMWHFYYGKGNSNTSAFCESKDEAKAFIDFIVASDYATVWNGRVYDLKHRYNNLVNKRNRL